MESFAMERVPKTNGSSDLYEQNVNPEPANSEQPKAKQKGAKRIVNRFFHYTTINGLQRLSSAKTIIGRLFWILVVLGALALFSRDLHQLIMQYIDRPVNVVSKINYFRRMKFPAITVCNVNPVRKSSQDFDDLNNHIEKELMNNDCFREDLRKNNTKCNEDDDEYGNFEDGVNYILTTSNETVLKRSGHQFRSFIVSCRYGGIRCRNMKYWTQYWDSQYGNCYIFNSRLAGNDYNVPLFTTRKPGSSDGLKLEFNIQLDEYIPELSRDAGVKLTITDPKEMPFPIYQSLSLAPGFQTDISLRRIQIQRVDRFNNGSCRSSTALGVKNHYRKKYNVSYSVQACLHDCYARSQIDACGCAEYAYLTATPMGVVCDESIVGTELCLKEWKDGSGKCDNNCRDPCVETLYEPSVSFTEWPSIVSVETVLQSLGKNYSHYNYSFLEVKSNYLAANVYFQRFQETKIEESLYYETANLLADIGGQIGLWAGLSVISMCELLELFALLMRHCLQRERQ